jgi:hypothetical protein
MSRKDLPAGSAERRRSSLLSLGYADCVGGFSGESRTQRVICSCAVWRSGKTLTLRKVGSVGSNPTAAQGLLTERTVGNDRSDGFRYLRNSNNSCYDVGCGVGFCFDYKDKAIKHSERTVGMSFNGRTLASRARYEGSIPSISAKSFQNNRGKDGGG